MLSINFGTETEKLAEEHFAKLKDWVIKRKNKYVNNSVLKNFIEDNLEEILKANPIELKIKDSEIKSKRFYSGFENEIRQIFNYKEFRKKITLKDNYNGFILSEKLGIDCCPYCNRNYTSSHQTFYPNKNGDLNPKYVFPEFDHFYPKEKYPLLAISFYNLIPSCNICNTHFKSDRNPDEIFNPYKTVSANHFSFKSFPNDVSTLYGAGKKITLDFDYKSDTETNEQMKNSIKFFGIKDTYEKGYSNLIEDIIYKRLAFSERYIDELRKTYKISFEEAYKILFETYFEDDKHYKRPFSKLKKDIFQSLKKV